MVGRASDILKLCGSQTSTEITREENDERAEKIHMKCISWGQAYHQNQMIVAVRENGKGADTIATKKKSASKEAWYKSPMHAECQCCSWSTAGSASC